MEYLCERQGGGFGRTLRESEAERTPLEALTHSPRCTPHTGNSLPLVAVGKSDLCHVFEGGFPLGVFARTPNEGSNGYSDILMLARDFHVSEIGPFEPDHIMMSRLLPRIESISQWMENIHFIFIFVSKNKVHGKIQKET